MAKSFNIDEISNKIDNITKLNNDYNKINIYNNNYNNIIPLKPSIDITYNDIAFIYLLIVIGGFNFDKLFYLNEYDVD